MKTNSVKFKTNIDCENCKTEVEKAFEGKNLYNKWEVDFDTPNKTATFDLVDGVSPSQVEALIKEAGYKAEVVEETQPVDKKKANAG